MAKIDIPEPKYYNLESLAGKLKLSIQEILNYGQTGQLKLSVYTAGWKIQQFALEKMNDDDFFRIPLNNKLSRNEIWATDSGAVREIIKDGLTINPYVFPEESMPNIGWIIHSDQFGDDVQITCKDIVIQTRHVQEFQSPKSNNLEEVRRTELAKLLEKLKSLHVEELDLNNMPGVATDFQSNILFLCPSIGALDRSITSALYKGILKWKKGNKSKKEKEYWLDFRNKHEEELKSVFK